MRYALISDIHANLPALRAVLDDIASRRGIDAIHHLGDLVGYGPWPNETVELIAQHGILGIGGNYDSTVAARAAKSGGTHKDPHAAELSRLSFAWTSAHVTDSTKRFLRALPFRLDLRPLGGHVAGPTVTLVHGTPALDTEYWKEDRPEEFSLDMARRAGLKAGDVIAFGHTHVPWHREIDGIHFVNTGSVGRPKDGDWRAGYVQLDVGDGPIRVEFVRVKYDIDETARGIRESGLPIELAHFLRTGGQTKS